MKRRQLVGLTVAAAVLAWALPALADDIVHLTNGGRLRGTVIEQDPGRGVTIQLPDRSFRYLTPADVRAVEYGAAPATPPAPAPAAPPMADGAAPPPADVPLAADALPPPADAPPADVGASWPSSSQSAGGAAQPFPPEYAPPPSQIYAAPPPPAPAPLPATTVAPREWQQGQPVPARQGFQLAIRLGGAFPHGNITKLQYSGDSAESLRLGRRVGGQAMLQVDLGWRTSPHWFWGAYLGISGGAVGAEPRGNCEVAAYDCRAQMTRVGALVQYHAWPDRRYDPWIEYGLGVQNVQWNDVSGDGRIVRSYSGLEWGLIGIGVDWRPNPSFGLGLFIRESLGTFSEVEVTAENYTSTERIADRDQSVHGWFMIGLRGILYP